MRDKIEAELHLLESMGVIAPVTEPTKWVSALLVVAKANGSVRLCLDPKPLNAALKRVPYCMPTLQDILPQLQKVKVMSSVDAKDGFFHCVLDHESSMLTTMETPFGRWRWLRLPFGTSPSPEIFQSRLATALSGLQGIAYIADDILIFSPPMRMPPAYCIGWAIVTALSVRLSVCLSHYVLCKNGAR